MHGSTYIRVHDGMDEHPKIEGLSDPAFRALMKCWFYCSRQLTNGMLTEFAWQNRVPNPRVRAELVYARLVHLPGGEHCGHKDCVVPPPGHVQMHDYLDHQRSAETIESLRRARAEWGLRGARKRWGTPGEGQLDMAGAMADAMPDAIGDAMPDAIGDAIGGANGMQMPRDRDRDRDITTLSGTGHPKASSTEEDPAFTAFYEAYPRREARRRAETAWRSAIKRASPEAIMAGLARFPFSKDRQFMPLPASWLNQDRWADEPPPKPKRKIEDWER